jgi:DNA polymerase
MNERGVYCDVENLAKANQLIEEVQAAANLRIKELTKDNIRPEGRVSSVNSIKQIRDWVDTQGFFIADLQKDTLEDVLSRPEGVVPPRVREVLKLRHEVGKSSLSKVSTMLELVDDDRRLRDGLVYHGASTGRLAGRAYQPHNFVRDAMKPKDAENFHGWLRQGIGTSEWFATAPEAAHTLTQALRSFLCASPGKTLMISDFAAVEARVGAWLAGVPSMLRAFEKGECVYSQFASMATSKTVTKGMPERQLGKVAVLGLQYQMGPDKFITTAAKAPYNTILSEVRSKEIVDLYRSVYPEIPALWRMLQHAMIEAVRRQVTVTCGKLTVGSKGDWAWIVLPSGRAIWYYKPMLRKVSAPWDEEKMINQVTYYTVDSQTRQWKRTATYGGKLTENVVQGIAGDLLMEAKKRVHAKGYPPILSVHDEVISEVDLEYGSVEEFDMLMKARPNWALDCPIECESHASVRYGK